jgi:hypothetical protein
MARRGAALILMVLTGISGIRTDRTAKHVRKTF